MLMIDHHEQGHESCLAGSYPLAAVAIEKQHHEERGDSRWSANLTNLGEQMRSRSKWPALSDDSCLPPTIKTYTMLFQKLAEKRCVGRFFDLPKQENRHRQQGLPATFPIAVSFAISNSNKLFTERANRIER